MELERRVPISFKESYSPKNNPIEIKESFTMRFLNKSISVSFIAIFFGLPIFFTGLTLQGVVFEKMLYFYFWLLIALVSFVTRAIIRGELKIRKTPLDVPLFVFVVAYSVSVFTSVDRFHSIWGLFGDPSRGMVAVIACILMYYLLFSQLTAKRVSSLVAALIGSSIFVMLWSLLAFFGVHFLPSFIERHAPLSLLGSITALMIFLPACLPLFVTAIASMRASRTKSQTFKVVTILILFLSICVDLFLLFLLFPYVSWFAVLVGFAFFVLYILARIIKIESRLLWLPMFISVVLLVIYMAGPLSSARVNLPIEAMPNRQLSWDIAKESMRSHFFLGSGPAMYGYDFSLYKPQSYNDQVLNTLRFNQGLGLYFESIATLGIVGTIALTLLLLSFLSVGFFLLAQKKDQNKFLSLGLWSMAMIMFLAAITSQCNGTVILLSILIATLALAVLMKESGSEETYATFSLQASPKFALTLAFIFLIMSAVIAFTFVSLGNAFYADILAAKAMESSIGDSDGIAKMTKSLAYMPYESRYNAYLSQIYLTMATQELNKVESVRDKDALKKYVELANNFAKVAQSQSPQDVTIQEIVAQTYENTLFITGLNTDVLTVTQKAYEQASFLEPHNPVYYLKLGQIKNVLAKSTTGDDAKARILEAQGFFEKSIAEKSDFILGYLNLGLLQEASGDSNAAISSLKKGITLDHKSKDSEEAKYQLARLLNIRGAEFDLKLAESILLDLLVRDDTNSNVYVTLGLIYEQTNRKDAALGMYEKAITLVSGDENSDDHKKIQKFIDTIKAGGLNGGHSTSIPQQFMPESVPENVPPEASVEPNLE